MVPGTFSGKSTCFVWLISDFLNLNLVENTLKRLDNGDKLKRRKTGFGAAKRTYEAIIWLQHEQLACVRARCEAAEAERDAAKAELRLEELANDLYACA